MTQRNDAWPAGTPCWADLTASDPVRTQDFYRAVLGWEYDEPRPEHGGYRNALVGGRPVAGLSPAAPDLTGVPHVWQVYLASDRIDLCAERVLAAGGTQLMEPVEVGGAGRMGVWQDPTGASFGMWQAGEHIGFAVLDVPGSVAWCDLMTPDHHTARDFYAHVFGYHYEDIGEDGVAYATFTVPHGDRPAGGIITAVGIRGAPSFMPASWVSHSSSWLPSMSSTRSPRRTPRPRSQFAVRAEDPASSRKVRRSSVPSSSTIHSASRAPRSGSRATWSNQSRA